MLLLSSGGFSICHMFLHRACGTCINEIILFVWLHSLKFCFCLYTEFTDREPRWREGEGSQSTGNQAIQLWFWGERACWCLRKWHCCWVGGRREILYSFIFSRAINFVIFCDCKRFMNLSQTRPLIKLVFGYRGRFTNDFYHQNYGFAGFDEITKIITYM